MRGRADVDLLADDAERVHQRPGIALGRLAGGEAGHGEAEDGRARQAEQVAGLGGDDQGVGRIEPARDADDEMLAARSP